MGRIEELEAENQRLKADRRDDDEQRWGILFRKCDEIKTCCAACGNQVKVNTVRLENLEVTVNGVGEQIGLKGHVSELRRESSVIKWVTGGLVTAAFLALADRFIGGKK